MLNIQPNIISECRVKGTSNICVFPFIYRGQIHHKCTFVESKDAWCAFNIDPYTDVTGKYNLMGNCEENCPKASKNLTIKSYLKIFCHFEANC